MANINDNLLVKGARGNVAKQFVYRKRGNKTFIVKMPQLNPNASQEQLTQRELFFFSYNVRSGRLAKRRPEKAYNRKAPPGSSAYNMALRDFLKAPVVRKIDTSRYTGTPGSTVIVQAKDDFRVAAVKVGIYIVATGAVVEEGNAVLDPITRDKWNYTATQAHAAVQELKIVATATDLPGNTGTLEAVIG